MAENDSDGKFPQLKIGSHCLVFEKRGRAIINEMPVKILTKIFVLAVHPGPGPAYRLKQNYGIHLSITQVCSHWRKVGLNYPLLWNDIRFMCPPWTHELLRRSRSAPLIAEFNLSDEPKNEGVKEARETVPKQLDRIEDLYL
ncbi:hypothetical protein AX16_002114 [Volvariella volvacea WC 439]|nr:hypothetical protein AX16_002114 [Volvariella volvacea WC 439]